VVGSVLPARPERPGLVARLAANPGFQALAARLPFTRGIVRHEGAAMFDLVAGFCHSQILQALVTLGTLDALGDRPQTTAALALRAAAPEDRTAVLLRAGASLGLLRERRGLWHLTRRGAALTGVPGLADMIAHHAVLYRDLSDPAAFFRGRSTPNLPASGPMSLAPAPRPIRTVPDAIRS
jgi:demethylspheroidene O-methyltransferase